MGERAGTTHLGLQHQPSERRQHVHRVARAAVVHLHSDRRVPAIGRREGGGDRRDVTLHHRVTRARVAARRLAAAPQWPRCQRTLQRTTAPQLVSYRVPRA
eukprot:2063583-Prymnesium_polylepis.1